MPAYILPLPALTTALPQTPTNLICEKRGRLGRRGRSGEREVRAAEILCTWCTWRDGNRASTPGGSPFTAQITHTGFPLGPDQLHWKTNASQQGVGMHVSTNINSPLHVFPSNWSVNPTGQLQWTPVDVSLHVRSQPPLFTAHVSSPQDKAEVCSGMLQR